MILILYIVQKIQESDHRPIAPVRQRPCQLLGEKRLEGLRPSEGDNGLTGEIDLPKGIKPSCPDIFPNGPLLTRVCSQLNKNAKMPMTGQKQTSESSSSNSDDNNLYREISKLTYY